MHRKWKSRVGVLALTATMGIGLVGLASPAGAADANAAAKASCRNDGWKAVLRTDGTAFKNQGDCVSYAAQGAQFAALCYDSNQAGFGDLLLTAPINTADNTTFTFSFDGTCSGSPSPGLRTTVSAPDFASANAKCQALIGRNVGHLLNSFFGYTTVPTDWWDCLP